MSSSRLDRGNPLRSSTSLSSSGFRDIPIKVPDIDDVLLSYLNEVFSDSLSLVTQLGTLEAAKGARTVVEHLQALHNQQQEK